MLGLKSSKHTINLDNNLKNKKNRELFKEGIWYICTLWMIVMFLNSQMSQKGQILKYESIYYFYPFFCRASFHNVDCCLSIGFIILTAVKNGNWISFYQKLNNLGLLLVWVPNFVTYTKPQKWSGKWKIHAHCGVIVRKKWTLEGIKLNMNIEALSRKNKKLKR